MAKGLVYILTNPCLDGWVKIGMTERDDINQRLRELNSPTSILFRIAATPLTLLTIPAALNAVFTA